MSDNFNTKDLKQSKKVTKTKKKKKLTKTSSYTTRYIHYEKSIGNILSLQSVLNLSVIYKTCPKFLELKNSLIIPLYAQIRELCGTTVTFHKLSWLKSKPIPEFAKYISKVGVRKNRIIFDWDCEAIRYPKIMYQEINLQVRNILINLDSKTETKYDSTTETKKYGVKFTKCNCFEIIYNYLKANDSKNKISIQILKNTNKNFGIIHNAEDLMICYNNSLQEYKQLNEKFNLSNIFNHSVSQFCTITVHDKIKNILKCSNNQLSLCNNIIDNLKCSNLTENILCSLCNLSYYRIAKIQFIKTWNEVEETSSNRVIVKSEKKWISKDMFFDIIDIKNISLCAYSPKFGSNNNKVCCSEDIVYKNDKNILDNRCLLHLNKKTLLKV